MSCKQNKPRLQVFGAFVLRNEFNALNRKYDFSRICYFRLLLACSTPLGRKTRFLERKKSILINPFSPNDDLTSHFCLLRSY
jgi:hypothetical protein